MRSAGWRAKTFTESDFRLPISDCQFPKSRRLRGRGVFKTIRDKGTKKSRGPLTLWAIRNDLDFSRIGISIGRMVGTAARRNRIKRLLREAFRLSQSALPAGYDWVIAPRPHEPLTLAEYRKLLKAMTDACDG
jgi:ribonuclease P protein component